MYKKQYLVACWNKQDAINALKKMYLQLNIDMGHSDLKVSKQEMKIVGKNIEIYFRTRNQIWSMELLFYGVAKTEKFLQKAYEKEIDDFKVHKQKTVTVYGRNDGDGLLNMYLHRG